MKTAVREIPFARPMIGEEEKKAAMEALASPVLVHGPRVKEFESAFCAFTGAPHAVAVSSCTAALHLAYFHLGIGPGDEVIVPAETHVATAHAVELCGAKPVFVDAELTTGNIDAGLIEEALGPRTRAVSVVHFLGAGADMEAVTRIAKKRDIPVIEDCALALGTVQNGIHAGLRGDVGCFSFYPAKHITTAEGGMLITRHGGWASGIAKKRAFGVDRHPGERPVPGVYGVSDLGFNYRMNEIEAAIGVEQMKRLPAFLARRRENHGILSRALSEIREVRVLGSGRGVSQESCYCLSVLLEASLVPRRREIIEMLKRSGVGTSVYYPEPVPHFDYYRRKYGYSDASYPVARRLSHGSIALPVGPHLDGEDMRFIAGVLKEAIREVGP